MADVEDDTIRPGNYFHPSDNAGQPEEMHWTSEADIQDHGDREGGNVRGESGPSAHPPRVH